MGVLVTPTVSVAEGVTVGETDLVGVWVLVLDLVIDNVGVDVLVFVLVAVLVYV